MERDYYLPEADKDRDIWLSNFATKVAALPVAWGVTAATITSLDNDAAAFHYDLLLIEAAKTFAHTCTASKDSLRNGPQTTTILAFPTFVPPPSPPTAVLPGIFDRVNLIAGQLKKNALFTEAIGILLGIVGAAITVDFSTAKPVLVLTFEGGFVHIKYTRGHAEGIFLYCMRGTETTFTLLAMVTKTTYVDARPNQTVGQPELRQYKAFFMVGDVAVGIESAVFSIHC